ncbi:MAG: S8 family serine peptidase [Phycisphaerae bacterium]|nr:S8 family serine peptidase [Phycisphaerae bacterium]
MAKGRILFLLATTWAALPATAFAQSFPRIDYTKSEISQGVQPQSAWELAVGLREGEGLAVSPNLTSGPAAAHPGRILVRTKPNPLAGGGARMEAPKLAVIDTDIRRLPVVDGLYLFEVDPAQGDAALQALRLDPGVAYAEPDFAVFLSEVPDDEYFSFQWGLLNAGDPVFDQPGVAGADINATAAWNLWTGASDFRVAVIDTGIDFFHPDLVPNIWTNAGEIPNNGVDDDGNGYVDDVHGYDVYEGDPDPTDYVGHGTHVSGTIAAVGNDGLGVAGVCWRAQIVPVKVFGDDGNGFVSALVAGIQYALDNDIPLSNNSYGLTDYSQALYDVIAEARQRGHLYVTAAGNFLGRDIDRYPVYPASFDLDNIVVAGATASDDTLSAVSCIGSESVDVGAPGQDILSTYPGGWAFATGTSMSSAFVTGVAALLMSRRPELDWEAVKSRMLDTVRSVGGLSGRIATGGVIDAAAAAGDCNENGVADEAEIAAGESLDCDGNGVPDECQDDCNGNGRYDACDVGDGTSSDCNGTGIPDECDLAGGAARDCNGNDIPDECDVATGSSNDLNTTGVPDECETCAMEADCDDGNPCTDESCTGTLCYWTDNSSTCDDGNECTENDICEAGVCSGSLVPTLDCAPLLSVRAAAINGRAVPGGPADSITADRGDRITVEFYIERWWPDIIQGINLYLDTTGFASGATGQLLPVVDPTPEAGAFMDRSRQDFIFYDLTTITIVQALPPDFYQYISVLVQTDDCAGDPGRPAYGGTLLLDISDTASGDFQLCLDPDYFERSFLIDCPFPVAVAPLTYSCLTIHVPLEGCQQGPDCNGNGTWDICDIAQGDSPDCNRNDVPDECDFAAGTSFDCNGNGLPDECDVAAETSEDCDGDLVPDECEPDCNGNGTPDDCDLRTGVSLDCNDNGIPDECDIASGTSGDCDSLGNGIPDECEPDCNSNGVADSCDIGTGTSIDADDNLIPDDCQVTRLVPQEYATLQAAIDASGPGDVVAVADGWYVGAGFRDIDFRGKVITVRSVNGPENCIIDGHGVGAVFRFRGKETRRSRLIGFTIINGALGVQVERYTGPTVRNCILKDHWGAAINLFLADPLFEDCLIEGNEANLTSWNVWSRPVYRRCTFRNNTRGGAILLVESDAVIENCALINNSFSAGAALYIEGSKPTIRGTTIVGNRAGTAGALYAERSIVTLSHSILWDNLTLDVPDGNAGPDLDVVYLEDSILHVSYSDISGGTKSVRTTGESALEWGPGNLTGNPLFQNTGAGGRGLIDGDVTLGPLSPCIDGGDPAFAVDPGASDIQGDPRKIFAAIDIGADEAVAFSDCNDNGLPDGRDIVEGRSADCNRNRTPDECDLTSGNSTDADGDSQPDECAAPLLIAAGPTQLRVLVAEQLPPVALGIERLSAEPDTGCADGFVQADGTIGQSPEFRVPSEWGAVVIRDGIVPQRTYMLRAFVETDFALPADGVSISTPRRADVNGDGLVDAADIGALTEVYGGTRASAETAVRSDLEPCIADGRIDARDLLRLVRILDGEAAACPAPCP